MGRFYIVPKIFMVKEIFVLDAWDFNFPNKFYEFIKNTLKRCSSKFTTINNWAGKLKT